MCVCDDSIRHYLAIGAVGSYCLHTDGIARPVDGPDTSEDDVEDEFDLVESFHNGNLLDPSLPDHAMTWLMNASHRRGWVHVFEEGNASYRVKNGRVLAVMFVC